MLQVSAGLIVLAVANHNKQQPRSQMVTAGDAPK